MRDSMSVTEVSVLMSACACAGSRFDTPGPCQILIVEVLIWMMMLTLFRTTVISPFIFDGFPTNLTLDILKLSTHKTYNVDILYQDGNLKVSRSL